MKHFAHFAIFAAFAALTSAGTRDRALSRDFATVELLAPVAPQFPKVGEVLADGGVVTSLTKLHIPIDLTPVTSKAPLLVEGVLFTPLDAGGYFTVWETKDGKVEWLVKVHNTLANEGANYLRDAFFKANSVALIANAPYVGLLTAAPSTTTTLATMTEASTSNGGYVRKQPTWTCNTTGTCSNTSAPASWTATSAGTGSIANLSYLVITDSASGTGGKFMAFAALTGAPYTVNTGATLNLTYTWTVQ
jgi:hypothetical protein